VTEINQKQTKIKKEKGKTNRTSKLLQILNYALTNLHKKDISHCRI